MIAPIFGKRRRFCRHRFLIRDRRRDFKDSFSRLFLLLLFFFVFFFLLLLLLRAAATFTVQESSRAKESTFFFFSIFALLLLLLLEIIFILGALFLLKHLFLLLHRSRVNVCARVSQSKRQGREKLQSVLFLYKFNPLLQSDTKSSSQITDAPTIKICRSDAKKQRHTTLRYLSTLTPFASFSSRAMILLLTTTRK